jgi:NADH-quinone oxidoreductase subunit K
MVPTTYYLLLGAALFSIGATGALLRRNALIVFISIELMLNAVNLSFVSFARQLGDMAGQVYVFFVLVVAAAEVGVGLAIIVNIYRSRATVDIDDVDTLRG